MAIEFNEYLLLYSVHRIYLGKMGVTGATAPVCQRSPTERSGVRFYGRVRGMATAISSFPLTRQARSMSGLVTCKSTGV
jgi:hypothetical protein